MGEKDLMGIIEEIDELKRLRNAVVLAHNYCLGEVQEAADFTGDSLELARKATQIEAAIIVFCGVSFMAETAKILNPEKTVLIPELSAGCPMAAMITGEELRAFKAKYPNAKAVCYVNSTAEVKAECDICVTSGNAEKVLSTFPPEEDIIFVPDQHLGGHVAESLGRKYRLWEGFCPIHNRLTAAALMKAKIEHPFAATLVHPECPKEVRVLADHCLSTGGMCKFVKSSPLKEFIIGTEIGILHRLKKENPGKRFYPVGELRCEDMKKLTLEKLRDALKFNRFIIEVEPLTAARARRAIEAMLAIA